MESTRMRRPRSPGIPPPQSPAGLLRSKSRSSATTLPENNSWPANASQRANILRSKSATKSRSSNKDEENMNPFVLVSTAQKKARYDEAKAGFGKFLKSSPASSPSAWALSPGRSLGSPLAAPESAAAEGGRGKSSGKRSGGGGGGVSSVLRFFRQKKTSAGLQEEEFHRLKILQNRLLQWKYANLRAEGAMADLKGHTEERIFSVWLQKLRLRNRILEKRVQVEKLRREIKLYRIIFPQLTLLNQWAKLNKRNQESVGSLASILSALSLTLPLFHGAKADLKDCQEALSMAMDVMVQLEATITKHTSQQLEKTLYVLTERLSIFKEQEECLDKLEDAVSFVTTLAAEESSVRIQLIQATEIARENPTS